jgi:hypothetical protein
MLVVGVAGCPATGGKGATDDSTPNSASRSNPGRGRWFDQLRHPTFLVRLEINAKLGCQFFGFG